MRKARDDELGQSCVLLRVTWGGLAQTVGRRRIAILSLLSLHVMHKLGLEGGHSK